MFTIKKLMVTIFAAALLSGSISLTAYASETAATDPQTVQVSAKSADPQTAQITATPAEPQAAQTTATPVDPQSALVTPTPAAEQSAQDSSAQAVVDASAAAATATENGTDLTGSDQEPVLGEGYFIDEQGQIYYDESSVVEDEPIIVDDPSLDEDQEDADDSKDTDTKDKDTKAQTDNKSSQIKKPSYSEEDLRLLSCLIYSEAGNQNYKGMLAVANVVLNRVKSDVFWHAKTVKAVIYDRKWSVQFAVTIKSSKTGVSILDKALKCYDSGKFTGPNPEAEKKAMDRAIKAAKAALEGKNNIGGYLCFQNKRCLSSIKKHYSDYVIVGDHVFYRTK